MTSAPLVKDAILFRVHSASPMLASTRYRALMPALGLEDRGRRCVVSDRDFTDEQLHASRCIVFAKAFRPVDLALAERAHALGAPIVLDLCDHIFLPEYGEGRGAAYADAFRAMAAWASAIVTTGPVLAEVLAAEASGAPVTIIPDQLETPELLTRVVARWHAAPRPPRWTARLAAAARNPVGAGRRAVAKLANAPPRPSPHESCSAPTAPGRSTIIWFGNHGASHSAFGMNSLEPLLPVLTEANKTHPLTLLIVSNSREKFDRAFADLPLPSVYREWSAARIFDDLASATICLLPNPRDAFSLCKSANRVALALSCGAAVIADDFPALEDFRSCVVTDDWAGGLALYLGDEERRRADIAKAREVIMRGYTSEVIAAQWEAVIDGLPSRT